MSIRASGLLGTAGPRAGSHGARVYRRLMPIGAGPAPARRASDGGGRVGERRPVAVEVPARLGGAAAVDGDLPVACPPALAPEARGRAAVVAAEGLGELRRLPVADPAGDLADGQRSLPQHLERTAHADLREVRAEAGLTGFGECPLELPPRGGQATGHAVELEPVRLPALDDVDSLLEEGAPP